MKKNAKNGYLNSELEHIDINTDGIEELIEAYSKMAFQSRNLANAAKIYNRMLEDKKCSVILCLAGSLFSAGLKKLVWQMVNNNMVDAIVSTGAVIVDQDFFEGLGFKHYIGTPMVDDEDLRKRHIDRIYDTYIDEDELRLCDETTEKIANSLKPGAYSSREFIWHMGKYLEENKPDAESVVLAAYRKGVPIFVPAFSDCSAGFGLVAHQWKAEQAGKKERVTIDSVKDFLELTKIKMQAEDTGLLMISGGVPKNFVQDTVVAAEVLGKDVPMHKYAIQITVADERDGGLSGSTLKEAHSWGKVQEGSTQMVYAEATLVMPLLAGYAYKKGAWKARKQRNWNAALSKSTEVMRA